MSLPVVVDLIVVHVMTQMAMALHLIKEWIFRILTKAFITQSMAVEIVRAGHVMGMGQNRAVIPLNTNHPENAATITVTL